MLVFLYDGRVEIHSNAVENLMRPVKLTAKRPLAVRFRRCLRPAVAILVGWLATVSLAAGSGSLAVADAWARATIGAATVSAVYLTVTNRGDFPDRLVGADAERAGHTTIHRSVVEDGVMKMRRAGAVEIPVGERVRLEPGGLHLMLTGVSPRLESGERIAVTLRFERAGEMRLSVLVRMTPP